jgi:signal transduction histidine kinase
LPNGSMIVRKIWNNSANGIIVASREGKVLYVNPAAELLFGRSKNDLEGELFGFPVASNQKTEIDIVRNGGELVIAEMRIVETEWNEEFAYLISLHDLTESRRMEEVVRQNQQQQLQIRDQFLSRMSHELRSPLTPIHQFVTILLDGLTGDLNAEQREYLQIILRNVTHLRTMVSDLLDVTRAESGKLNIDLRCVYLTELIPPILKTFQLANTKGLLMSFDVPDNLPPICADPDRVRQILDNLLDNAIKFSSEKGEVRVRARVSNQDPGFLRIEVTDTGHGISPGEQGKIFNYLYQVKSGDTSTSAKSWFPAMADESG